MDAGKIILFAGLSVLTAGALLTAYSFSAKQSPSGAANTESLIKKLDAAEPRFEIGYTTMSLDFYKRNLALYKSGDSSLLTFPVYETDIAARIATNSPPLVPGYDAAIFAGGSPDGFERLYKKKLLQHRSTGIICLILKQVGAGDAYAATLQTDKVSVKGIYELYDALELVGDSLEGRPGINGGQNKYEKQALALGTMKTGSALLIPLCITNMYWRTDGETDPSGWQVTSQTAYVPLSISFVSSQHRKTTLSVRNSLKSPIYME